MRKLFNSQVKVTQTFANKLIVDGKDYYAQFGLVGHEGLDIVPTGTVWDVYCLEDGVVVKDEDNAKSGSYGIYLTIWHPTLRKATQYCHLSENYVNLGDKVSREQKIGKMGATGNTRGAHCHLNLFETDENGYRLNKNNGFLGGIDPLPFLQESTDSSNSTALEECNRLLTEEKKKKQDNWQWGEENRIRAEGAEEQVKTLQGQLTGLGELLGTTADIGAIRSQITMLIEHEDQTTTITQLKKQVDQIMQERDEYKRKFEDRNIEAVNLQKEVDGLRQELEKTQAATDLVVQFQLGGLYFCTKKVR